MELGAVRRMGEELMAQHGLDGWGFGFDNAKRRAGLCRFDRRRITVSRTLVQLYGPAEVRDTILHEIAHALAGPAHGHDRVWRATAHRIGCSGRRLVAEDAPRAPAPWTGTCPAGHEVPRHRRPTAPASCTRCSRTFSTEHLLQWTFHGRPVAMPPAYERQLAALLSGTRPGPVAAAALADDDGDTLAQLVTASGGLSIGTTVRVTVPGRYAGVVGQVEKVGRTRYHLRVRGGLLTVSFGGVERLMGG